MSFYKASTNRSPFWKFNFLLVFNIKLTSYLKVNGGEGELFQSCIIKITIKYFVKYLFSRQEYKIHVFAPLCNVLCFFQ